MTASQFVGLALSVAGLVAALWLVAKGARGTTRVLGLIGTVLIILGVLSRFVRPWIETRFLGRGDAEQVISTLAAMILIGGVLTGAGLLLVTRAIVVAGRLPKI